MEDNSINQVLLISSPIVGQFVGIKSLKEGDIIGRAQKRLTPALQSVMHALFFRVAPSTNELHGLFSLGGTMLPPSGERFAVSRKVVKGIYLAETRL